MKLKKRLAMIKKATPKVSRYGQLYATKKQTQRRFSRITLYTLFVSSEDTHLLLPHVFHSRHKARTPAEWHVWLGALVSRENGFTDGPAPVDEQRLTHIHRTGILPGLAARTNKDWAVKRVIGWVGGERKPIVAGKRAK